MVVRVRPACDSDLGAIVEIFNEGIDTRTSTGYLAKVTVEDRRAWFASHASARYPLLVAEDASGVVGYVSLDPYRAGRHAFRRTTEASLFVSARSRRSGVGSLLLSSALEAARQAGFTTVLAIVLDKNVGSIRLLEKFGFRRWGLLPKVGEIDDVMFDHAYYGLHLLV
jgi:phosphinothricin acetyltransferase